MKTQTLTGKEGVEGIKYIPGYEGLYGVNKSGEVFSFKNGIRKLSLFTKKTGYQTVSLSKDGNQTTMLVHRAVMMAFVENTENKPCVNHINGIKYDNTIENLEWCTYKENMQHSVINGLFRRHDISEAVVLLTKNEEHICTFKSANEASKFLPFASESIRRFCQGKRKIVAPYNLMYAKDFLERNTKGVKVV
jgi:hypothetical protein